MLDIIGDIVTLNFTNYLVICEKKVDDKELYVVISVTDPSKLELMEIREGENGKAMGRLYAGEYQQSLFQESAQEIMEALSGIRERASGNRSVELAPDQNQN